MMSFRYHMASLGTLLLIGCSGSSDKVIEASGTIEGIDVNVGTEVSGRVKEIRVDEGSRVKKGDTLLVLDDTELQIQLRQSTANMESYASAYRLAVEGSRKEDIVQAEANFKTAEADFNRMKELLASHTITQKQYDDVYARYVSAQQTYQKLKTGSRPEEISAAKERRESALAQVDLLKKKVRDCTILAPMDGIITLRAVEQGELVPVGANIFRITYLDRVRLTIYVGETDLGRIAIGNSAKVSIDAYKDRWIEGKVIYISPVAEFTPKNVQSKEERTKLVFGVKLEIPNPEGMLKPGLPADAMVEVRPAGDVR